MADSAPAAEPLFTLTPRERALLSPHFAVIEEAEQVIQREKRVIGSLVRMKAGRDDVMLNPATGGVYAIPTQEPGSDTAGT